MNANAQKWIAALRSGAYQQTKERLYNPEDGGYCCLGVACDLYGQEHGDTFGNDGEFLSVRSYLPPEVQIWLELSEETGTYDNETKSLANDNDEGASFDDIAKIIESEPKGLFNE